MSKKGLAVLLAIILCGSAIGRPAQAFFTNQTNLDVVLQTADWQPPTSKLLFNNQEIVSLNDRSPTGWFDCDTLEPFPVDSLSYELTVQSFGPKQCIQKQLTFSPNQLRTISIQYQLSAAELLEVSGQPLIHFLWNDAEIGWISRSNNESDWITLNIPGSDLTGIFSIIVVADELLEIPTQFQLIHSSSNRVVLSGNEVLVIENDEATATVFISTAFEVQPIEGRGQMIIHTNDLPELGTLLFWSVDSWGNTESPKTVEYQVIHQRPAKLTVLWQQIQDNTLFLVAQTSPIQTNVFVNTYRLAVADAVIDSKLVQPWIPADQAWHQPGTLVGLSFLLPTTVHAARLESVDQASVVSLASDLITF